jgi:hypothetical protein
VNCANAEKEIVVKRITHNDLIRRIFLNVLMIESIFLKPYSNLKALNLLSKFGKNFGYYVLINFILN